MIRPCFLGAGVATHLGTGVAENLAALHRPPQTPQIVERHLSGRTERIPCKLLHGFPDAAEETRLNDAVAIVIEEALRTSGLRPAERRRMALSVGSSSFDISISEIAYRKERAAGRDALPLRSSSFANLAEWVRGRFSLLGEDYSFNTACTSSSNALWYAARMIRSGAVDNALVLGVELINDLTALGFLGLGLLSRSEMLPFDAARDGLVLGEACAALIVGRGDADRFHWRGGANVSDTHSMVAPSADGSTIASAIALALGDARLSPADIDAVKAHGTANPANDDAEAAGMLHAFPVVPPVVALKPFLGHTLGASGLTETILFYRALEEGFLVATPGIGAKPELCGVALNQIERPMTHGHFMLNTFGFGGNNTSLVIARA
jgi:3-oxoacyl-[acyl-carrier-protein] synthase-1